MGNYALTMDETQLNGTYKGRQSFLRVLTNALIKIKALTSKNDELNSLITAQKRIISILAHDLRNPLSSIKTILEYKQADILSSHEAGEMLTAVSGQLTNTIDMVDNLVAWGKLHIQSLQLNVENVNLHQLVDTILGSVLLSSKAKNNKLINGTPHNAFVSTDKRVLEFILRNLVSNANKFTENGCITVEMRRGVKTMVTVTDTGVGMTVDVADKLFKENTNVESAAGTKNEKGDGLGLLLVKEFIARLNGTIKVESQINKGTVFTVEF